MCKKVAKSFGGSKIIAYLCTMNQPQFVITGISRLTGEREEISRPMDKDEAQVRLDREIENRKRQKYPAYTRLRVERRLPVQLTINFYKDEQ